MFVSVIITTYNRAKMLADCLDSLLRQSVALKDFEVVLVNDGCTDKTDSVVLKYKKLMKNLVYIKQENLGQAKARNLALKKIKGKIVVFIGDDSVLTRDFLFEHQKLHYLNGQSNVGVLGFTTWHPKILVNEVMEWMVNGSSVLGKFGGHQFAYEKLKGKNEADFNFFYTSNLSMKADLIKKEGFCEEFGSYGWEDIELGYRLEKKYGFKLLYNSSALAYKNRMFGLRDLESRMKSIGKSVWVFDSLYPELKKVPVGMKLFVFKLISKGLFLKILQILSRVSKKCRVLYFYCLSKKWFLEGVESGRGKVIVK